MFNRLIPEKYLIVLLFFALLFVCLIFPVIRDQTRDRPVLLNLSLTAVLILGSAGGFRRRVWTLFGVPAIFIAVGFTWTGLFVDYSWLFVTNCLLQAGCFLVMACLLLYRVFTEYLANWISMLGAVCGYLLIGLCWTMLYVALLHVNLEALQFDNPVTAPLGINNDFRISFSQLVYFSFVTMSTLGYGDIVPRIPLALTLTWTQSVIGQFYLAVLVARLVGVLPSSSLKIQSEMESPH
tara:strand:+ start:217 stop:930 length:714 start_codon:yes stop_codon:yes gene_type:complete